MSRTVIAPIIAFLVLAVKLIFKIEIPDDVVAQFTNNVVVSASLIGVIYGIIKNHKK